MIFEIKNNKIRFSDTDNIRFKTFEKLLSEFESLGYDFDHEPDYIRQYFNKNEFLPEDQTAKVIEIFRQYHMPDIPKKTIKKYNDIAVSHFGLTDNFKMAGYILPNGDMLNFSYDNYLRDIDHRDVNEILDYIDSNEITAGMIEFMNYGNIRIIGYDIDLVCRPTPAQRRVISDIIRISRRESNAYESHSVDISNIEGDIMTSFRHTGAFASDVLNNINTYFDALNL